MAPDPETTVRRALDAFNRGDIEGMLAYLTPDVELTSAIISGAEGGGFHGHDGIRQWAAEVAEIFSVLRLEFDELRPAEGDVVVGLGRLYVRSLTDDVEMESPSGWVCTLRDGKLARVHGFLNREDALRAAGLPA